jgi:hypothetical protein
MPPDESAAFQEPDYVKIIWTLPQAVKTDAEKLYHRIMKAA